MREKLLGRLTEPRTVKEIAVGANRTSSNITGHFRAMRQKNLVARLSWGVWVRRDKWANAPDHAGIAATTRHRSVCLGIFANRSHSPT